MKTVCLIAILIMLTVLTWLAAQSLTAADSAAPWAATSAPIHLTNYQSGETIRYPAPLIRGVLTDQSLTQVTVINTSSDRPSGKMVGQAHDGRFKALAELIPGENHLLIRAGEEELAIKLTYRPSTNSFFVRVIYATDNSDDTTYQSPDPNDEQNYADKIDAAMKLMQTAVAERMHDLGFGRRTFNLEFDDNGKVLVHPHQGDWPAKSYYELDDQTWHGRIHQEIRRRWPSHRAKNLVIAAYTRYDAKNRRRLGHTALGGAGTALVGGGNLFTWPSHLDEAQSAFLNVQPIDRDRFIDDSAGRGVYWGAVSTTIGAALHELGHTFGLPHTNDPADIMTRGFDYFHRIFVLTEAPSRLSTEFASFDESSEAKFAPISAAALAASPWMQANDPDVQWDGRIDVRYDDKQQALIVDADYGVRYLGALVDGEMRFFQAPTIHDPAPNKWTVSLSDIRNTVGEATFVIRIIDGQGLHKDVAAADILPPSDQTGR